MFNNVFTIEEAENFFEIGRLMQAMADNEEIEINDSKEAFAFAIRLAIEFEEAHSDTEDYYFDLDEFVIDKILEEFGVDN